MAFAGAQDFLRQNHLAPLLTNDVPALQTLNKWTQVGTALQVRARCARGGGAA
jgi:hypothetical protein